MDHRQTVRTCYAFFDALFPACGMPDYTEGIYGESADRSLDQAQRNQIDFVLDEAGCRAETRILDIGCGNGELLAAAEARGATALGITVSREQQAVCQRRGLDVLLLDYRRLSPEYVGTFDAVIANGSIEHFVPARAAAEGRDDTIYREMFDLVYYLIAATSPIRRFVTTTIHFVRRPDPEDLLRAPWHFPFGSDSFHYALINRSFGGWYPVLGQFERCAQGRFRLRKTIDGTNDYRLTSETWLNRVRKLLREPRVAAAFVRSAVPIVARQPKQCLTMLACMLVSQSWNWQFRGPDPPTRLLRQTWDYNHSATRS